MDLLSSYLLDESNLFFYHPKAIKICSTRDSEKNVSCFVQDLSTKNIFSFLLKDEQTRREKAVENALVIAEKKWNEKRETGVGRDKKWEEEIKSLKDEWNKEKDREIVENLKKVSYSIIAR